MKNWHKSQRGFFAGQLYEEMKKNEKIIVLTGDLGYGMFDKIRDKFPKRFINVGASEQAGLGICVGLAQEGFIPLFYTITSFFLRGAETISLYLSGEQCPVILVGGGRHDDYKEDGISHYAYDAQDFFEKMNISCIYPNTKKEASEVATEAVNSTEPLFISLQR